MTALYHAREGDDAVSRTGRWDCRYQVAEACAAVLGSEGNKRIKHERMGCLKQLFSEAR